MKLKVLGLGLCLCFSGNALGAADLPSDELAKESVLPRFERGEVIKNRTIVQDKRFEIGGYFGWNFTEPIYSQTKFGLNLGYHFTDAEGLGINFVKWMEGRNTQYTDLLKTQVGLDFNRVPNLVYSAWANWEHYSYYGKISLTKKGVMNSQLYPILGLGITGYTNKTYPGLNFGLGQKYFFSKNIGLRFDFKLQYQQGPSPFLGGGKLLNSSPASAVSPSDFEDKWSLGTILDVGLTILL